MHRRKLRYRLIFTAAFGAVLVSCGSSETPMPTATFAIRTSTATVRAATPSPTEWPAQRSTVVPLALGGSHTCAMTVANGVVCWGNNRYGQLGNGTFLNSSIPTEAARLTSGVVAIAAGTAHTCALRAGGGVECWGTNTKGQLGDSTTDDSRSPVAVYGLSEGVKAVAAGDRHTCALLETGAVECWGENASGGLGDGTGINRSAPVDVSGMTGGVTALEAGAGHTCALMEDGAVKCWGWNTSGQLGDGTVVDSRVPVDVGGLPGPAQAVAAGDQHTCALLTGGSVVCWGANASGQLGNGTRTRSSAPVAVAGLSGVLEIAAGGAHTCALQADGAVKCWGDDQSGQLGDGGYENQSSPVAVGGLSGTVDHIAAGFSHTCAIMTDKRIQCWGWNTEGQLGDGTVKSRRIPGDTLRFTGGVAAVSVGWSNTCALLTAGGGIRCWGLNGGGQLGDGEYADSGSPVEVNGLGAGRISVAVGGAHVCALSGRGGVKCWGRNDRGQLGNGNTADQNNPVDVTGLPEEAVAIAAGKDHTCALTFRGGVKCWGANESGQLGNGATADSAKPVDVSGLSAGVSAIAAGGGHTCALTFRGGVKCWGNNKYGQLGDGTQEDRSTPVDVGGLAVDVDFIAAGGFHTCAIVSGVTLKCWGWNAYGQLGDSTPTDRPLPANVLWLAGTPASVSAGSDFTCAVMRLGNLRCWGNNEFGQLGDGSNTVHHTPVDVRGLDDKAGILTAGYYSACTVTVHGQLKCWGNNLYGQLGDGAVSNSNVPVDVVGLE
jgi:alpha-tubulin suppressor-like RCC1 family protein